MQQAVNTTQIDERTVVGEVLDVTLGDLTLFQGGQKLFALSAVGFLQNGTTRNNDVVALRIQLDQFEVKLFAFQVVNITHRTNINQGARQEALNVVDADSEAALDLA